MCVCVCVCVCKGLGGRRGERAVEEETRYCGDEDGLCVMNI